MGLDFNNTKFLLWCRDQGVNFERTATIGRQGIYLGPEDQARFGLSDLRWPWCEALLYSFGAKKIWSYDYSDYEGATCICDLNKPLARLNALHSWNTAVIEFGALEHVFNFPVAIETCMALVEVGGHYIGSTPTNGTSGHGFYQFSSDLIYSVFEQNGFQIEHMHYQEEGDVPGVEVPRVVDQGRVMIRTTGTTYLQFLAKKLSDQPFTMPQQTDYTHIWKAGK